MGINVSLTNIYRFILCNSVLSIRKQPQIAKVVRLTVQRAVIVIDVDGKDDVIIVNRLDVVCFDCFHSVENNCEDKERNEEEALHSKEVN